MVGVSTSLPDGQDMGIVWSEEGLSRLFIEVKTMATRGLIGLRKNGEEILSYNHNSSNVEYLGVDILHQLQAMTFADLSDLYDRTRVVPSDEKPTPEELKQVEQQLKEQGVSIGGGGEPGSWYDVLRQVQGKLDTGVGLLVDGRDVDPGCIEYKYVVDIDHKTLEIFADGMYNSIGLDRLKEMTDQEFIAVALNQPTPARDHTKQAVLDEALSGDTYDIFVDDSVEYDPADFGCKYGKDERTGEWLGHMPDQYTVTIVNNNTQESFMYPVFPAQMTRDYESKYEQYDRAMERVKELLYLAVEARNFDLEGFDKSNYRELVEVMKYYEKTMGEKPEPDFLLTCDVMIDVANGLRRVMGADIDVLASMPFSGDGIENKAGKIDIAYDEGPEGLMMHALKYVVDKVEMYGEICQPTHKEQENEWLCEPDDSVKVEQEISI